MRPADDSTERFTERAGDYAAARPGYPAAIATTLVAELKPPRAAVVAGIGSGTGLSWSTGNSNRLFHRSRRHHPALRALERTGVG